MLSLFFACFVICNELGRSGSQSEQAQQVEAGHTSARLQRRQLLRQGHAFFVARKLKN